MNEPSVFNGPENSFPKDVVHYLADKTKVLGKDVKSSYGLLMMQATYKGLVER
jgi:alpha-glucosidase (family GH31 glycosyl hydrolase)